MQEDDEEERKSSSDDLELPLATVDMKSLKLDEDPPLDDDPPPPPAGPPPRPKEKARAPASNVDDWFASLSLDPLGAADQAMPVASSRGTTASKFILKPKAKADSTASAASNPIESSDGLPSSRNEPVQPDPKKREFWEKLESAKSRHIADIPCAVMSLGSKNVSS